MLERLNIRNFALIDDIEVEFTSGLNVLTGETGAGKSIVVNALKLALGHRASSGTIRRGTDRSRIEALFRDVTEPEVVRLLDDMGVELDDGSLILARVIQKNRSRCYVNGQLCPAQTLLAIGRSLVDFHGQHEHQSLLDPARQMLLLDGFGELDELRKSVVDRYSDWRAAVAQKETLEIDERERLRRIDILRHETNEIRSANLRADEEEEIDGRRRIVANAETLFTLASESLAIINGESTSASLRDMWSELESRIDSLAAIDGQFTDVQTSLSSVRAELDELAYRLTSYSEQVEFNPSELDQIDARMAVLRRLKRKYGPTIEDVIEYGDRCSAELQDLDSHDKRMAEMEKECAVKLASLLDMARNLSKKRRAKAKTLASKTLKELRPLAMDSARLDVDVTRSGDDGLGPTGLDKVAILFSANPGEDLKPLRDVASGGELSRVMLALKVVLADTDRSGTLVFDEVDSGVGRTVAGSISDKLRSVSRRHQVLCITHLPAIAAAADNHIHVEKSRVGKRTVTRAEVVKDEDRVREIAKLLAGTDKSGLGLEHAREMLARSRHDDV